MFQHAVVVNERAYSHRRARITTACSAADSCRQYSSLSSDVRTNSCSINEKCEAALLPALFFFFFFVMLISVVRPSHAAGLLFFCFVRSPLSLQKLQSPFLSVPFCSSSLLFVFLDSLQPPKLVLLPWMVIFLWFKADTVATQQGCLRFGSNSCRAECTCLN